MTPPPTGPSAAGVARQAKNSRALSMLARTGYAVNGILHRGADITQTIAALLERPFKTEG
ncbi:MAG: hypothetical protein V4479_08125 [Actinomycetota bacterium]